MMKIRTVTRYKAFGWHLIFSTTIALFCASIVFYLWYPGLLAKASGVINIFMLLLIVDVVLGPIITLIVFNPLKKELKRDLFIVIAIQLIALTYGLYTVFVTRPVYIVFNSGAFDVVHANEISKENQDKATRQQFRYLSYFGPEYIAAHLPKDPKVAEKIILSAVSGGNDIQHLPEYYLPYIEAKDEVIKQLKPLSDLKTFNKDSIRQVNYLIERYETANTEVGFLPLKGKLQDLTVVISRSNGEILETKDLRPRL